jgi:hypothetical protein
LPLLITEYERDNQISAKHQVEEAMSTAMIRKCNGCQKRFFKEEGCNDMRCPSCNNRQCFVCSKNVTDYSHYDRTEDLSGPQDCPLYDNTRERLQQEVAAAQNQAVQEILQNRAELNANDVTVDENLVNNRQTRGPAGAMRRQAEERARQTREQEARERRDNEEEQERLRLEQIRLERLRAEAERQRRERERLEEERRERERLEAERRRRERERQERERRERERLEAERQEAEQIQREIEAARLRDEQEAVAEVRQFEERQRLEEQRQLDEILQLTLEDDKWRAFHERSEALSGTCDVTEDLQGLCPEQLEFYWAGQIQFVMQFIDDARQRVDVVRQRRPQKPLSQVEESRHTETMLLLQQAEISLERLRKDAVIRKANAIRAARTKGPKLKTKKSMLNFWKRKNSH